MCLSAIGSRFGMPSRGDPWDAAQTLVETPWCWLRQQICWVAQPDRRNPSKIKP
jgi:hypothetical protein